MKFNSFYKWLSRTFGGLTFAALCADAGIPAQGEPGPRFVQVGEWVGANAYNEFELVTFEGSSYYAVQDVPEDSAAPDQENSPYWNLVASKGDKGDTGDPGTNGDQIDISAFPAVSVVGATDLILLQVGSDLKKITFDDFVTAVTTAQGA